MCTFKFLLVKKLFYSFYIFLQFCLTSLRGKEYFVKLNQQSGAGCFWPLGAGATRKKISGAGAAWEKIRSRSLKKIQQPEPEQLKNLPAPQPLLK